MTPFETDLARSVGISVSDSPDLGALGLSDRNLRDAMAQIARKLLACGFSLAYGGDLRQHGFTRLLAELVGRYQNHPRHAGTIRHPAGNRPLHRSYQGPARYAGTIAVTDYLAWPVHISMTSNELTAFSAGHEPTVHLVFLTLDGARLPREQRLELSAHEPHEDEWTQGLTAMRTVMLADIRARVVLGGRVEGYKGKMPGIAEEMHLSLEAHQPVFVLGGFGGCARDIAETLGLVDPWSGSREEWSGREDFRRFTSDDLHNGLSRNENLALARTPHIEEAVHLVSRGLRQVFRGSHGNTQSVH